MLRIMIKSFQQRLQFMTQTLNESSLGFMEIPDIKPVSEGVMGEGLTLLNSRCYFLMRCTMNLFIWYVIYHRKM